MRIKGLKEFKNIQEKIVNTITKNQTDLRKQGIEYARYLDLKLFSAWIIQNKVIDFIFKENPHSELIKRSYNILFILAQDEVTFPIEIVNNIWSCCVEKHEDIIRAGFELITELSNCLPISVL